MTLKILYVTVPDEKTGREISYHLLKRKLIACSNIFSPHTAIYEWEGQLNEDKEYVMILKTQSKHIDSLLKELVEIHPYDTPCAIVIDPEKANSGFNSWVEGQTIHGKISSS